MTKLLLFAAPLVLLSAQQVIQHDIVGPGPGPRDMVPASAAVEFLSMEMGSSSIVKNSPYSAEAVTETVQTLADGNRIVRKNSVMQYRDGEGRTRREFDLQSIGGLGDLADGLGKSIMIDDPIAKANYQLHAKTKTAMKMPRGEGMITLTTPRPSPNPGPSADVMIFGNAGTTADAHVVMSRKIARREGGADAENARNSKSEDLGARNIEGVDAKGTRTTLTIPAGEVGNERPIEVVSERWYSEQLKTLVLSKHLDPRFGETTLRLTNVRLSEPSSALFEVPADYTVQDALMRTPQVRRTIEVKREE